MSSSVVKSSTEIIFSILLESEACSFIAENCQAHNKQWMNTSFHEHFAEQTCWTLDGGHTNADH